MKKLIALLMVCGFAMTFVACGGSTSQSEAQEVPATEEPAAPAEEVIEADSVEEVVEADSTAGQE